MKISDIVKAPEFFPEAVFVEVKNILGRTFELKDYTPYSNDKGEGVAMLIQSIDGDLLKVCTHAKAIVRMLGDESFLQVWNDENHPAIMVTFSEKISKTGAKYFIIE